MVLHDDLVYSTACVIISFTGNAKSINVLTSCISGKSELTVFAFPVNDITDPVNEIPHPGNENPEGY